jgi:hypothetical protein
MRVDRSGWSIVVTIYMELLPMMYSVVYEGFSLPLIINRAFSMNRSHSKLYFKKFFLLLS